jgi:hypothetical protein
MTMARIDDFSVVELDDERKPFPTRRVALLACVGVVLLVFLRSGLSYGKRIDPTQRGTDFHNRVADALVHGQTNLRPDTPQGLLELENPYDPIANFRYRKAGLHDLSLYKGKLYAFFGPAPAILLFIPFRVLRVGELSPVLGTLAFCTLGFGFSYLLFRKLTRRFFGDLPTWMECFAIIALGLAVPAPFIIYVGRGYEVSIACGYFLLFSGLYFLVSGLLSETRMRLLLLALGSAALAIGVGARPNLITAGLFVVIALVIVIRQSRGEPTAQRVKQVAAAAAPYVIVGVLLALYNLVRFDSVTEFGQKYQLAGTDSTRYAFYQLWYIPRGLYYYLLAPARFTDAYPYVHLLKPLPPVLSKGAYNREPVAGVLTNMPLIGFGLVLTVTQIPRLARDSRLMLVTVLSGLVVGLAIITGASFTLGSATMRYGLDFAPLLLITVLLAWVFWNLRLKAVGARYWVLQTVWILALGASVLFNLAITLTPCRETGTC